MREAVAVVEAYIGLIAHDRFMSLRTLAELHLQIRTFSLRPTKSDTLTPSRISHAMDIACALYPKEVLCLQRSAVLVMMLRKRGIAACMVIGAQKLPFKAHAWVEVDGLIVGDRVAAREEFMILEVC